MVRANQKVKLCMPTTRLLLPFTGWLDTQALDYAIELAQCEEATLVLLSLIVGRLERKGGKIRLEQIQQSKDFLVLATHKARRAGVMTESHEISTYDAVRSLTLQAQEQMCDAILLFVRDKRGVLLRDSEVKRTLEWQGIVRCVIYIPVTASKPLHAVLWTRLARLSRKPGYISLPATPTETRSHPFPIACRSDRQVLYFARTNHFNLRDIHPGWKLCHA
jgi:hypothetical protein